MMNMKRAIGNRKFSLIIFGAAFFFFSILSFGQEQSGMVKYTPDFRFEDGIYLNFDQVKANRPVPKSKILTSADYNDRDFFNKVFASEKIYFYDEMGVRQEVKKDDIWGYARNGILYVMIQGNFNRITFVGNICHFVADVTTYDNNYYSPYGYYDPYYYYPYSYYGGYYPYGMYYSPYYSRPYNTARNELRQYIIDFESGKVLEFTIENVKLLIMKDPELYEEFVKLPKKKQKELMFVYVRKFNERNPLYLPEK
ncbi:MAG TPA: hypothetical protein PLN06_08320 [Bacteroidales bacterium]|nr:hypothetical protein [Bacteroidales bacterium]HOU96611.1 hypothetical protein [Bacteroidales bacterium]HQG53300.1 hypothetical protein [Bacteroidales bacterium]